MSKEKIVRQICLILSIFTFISGMCLILEQTDACFSWETSQNSFGQMPVAVISSGDTLSAPEFSCTGEMLGQKRSIAGQQAIRRFFDGMRVKTILALSFAGLFLFLLILFQMAVKHYGVSSKKRRRAVIQYIHRQDGKKRNPLQASKIKYCDGGTYYANRKYSCSYYGCADVFGRCLGMVERTFCTGRQRI